jgi:hypothetical protein
LAKPELTNSAVSALGKLAGLEASAEQLQLYEQSRYIDYEKEEADFGAEAEQPDFV